MAHNWKTNKNGYFCANCGLNSKYLLHTDPCSAPEVKPLDNPKEGDVEEETGELQRPQNRYLGTGLANDPDLYKLTALQQIRIAALNTSVQCFVNHHATYHMNHCSKEIIEKATDFENYILNGAADDGEKQNG